MMRLSRVRIEIECPYCGAEGDFTTREFRGGKLEGTYQCVCGAVQHFEVTATKTPEKDRTQRTGIDLVQLGREITQATRITPDSGK